MVMQTEIENLKKDIKETYSSPVRLFFIAQFSKHTPNLDGMCVILTKYLQHHNYSFNKNKTIFYFYGKSTYI